MDKEPAGLPAQGNWNDAALPCPVLMDHRESGIEVYFDSPGSKMQEQQDRNKHCNLLLFRVTHPPAKF
jgi:hypothetical protein